MPLLGFIGFPVFALECWSVFHLLACFGISTPELPRPDPVRIGRKILTAAAGVVFAVVVLSGMERFTISSTTPSLVEVPGVPPSAAFLLIQAGESPFLLAQMPASAVAREAGTSVDEAQRWIEAARLVTLRGIGTENARCLARIGITSIAALAIQDPDSLAVRLTVGGARTRRLRPTPAQARVWVKAALNALHSTAG